MAGEEIPEDVFEDLELAKSEVEKELERARGKRKRRYPSNSDIAEAIKELAGYARVDPQSFPERVREKLEEQGFYTGLVTDERIWRVYETLLRKGEI
ncbi:hypothetical protein APE_0240a [Aeropyrum pernix K1]|uniref:Uncharacterized protein n=1 Tax=Aeropyrum pernix (strain ATCC 700893 / DSM 11879 / JCM 9820 / NBRC 100138 / K1) TaxID=272557 RepID=Q05E87_AERPE|nr:hypothetical protein [Aeropyrum pernix]BAF34714.1 hypothetical protein APE_0240a [Aeropyrum pernix K1]